MRSFSKILKKNLSFFLKMCLFHICKISLFDKIETFCGDSAGKMGHFEQGGHDYDNDNSICQNIFVLLGL